MTPEERQMLTDLANKVAQTPAPAPDAEAEEFIRTHIGNRPDALYLLTQTVLIQNMAIDHAKQEIQQLQQRQVQAPAAPPQGAGASWLGQGGAWSPQPPVPQQYQQPPQGYAPAYAPAYAPPVSQSGMGSFLRSAGTTAAGVAAGALAFEGIRSLFGGAEHLFGFGNQPHIGSGFLGNAPGGETIINNYYDNPQQSGGGDRNRFADDLGPNDSTDYDTTSASPDDTADGNYTDDTADVADTSVDDSSSDPGDSSSGGDDLT